MAKSLKTTWTTRWRKPSTSRPAFVKACAPWPQIGADLLRQVREPLGWALRLGPRGNASEAQAVFASAARGPVDDKWETPGWLLPHQVDAVRRLAGSLAAFGGALCADAVGLGKTYIALALATRYRRAVAVVPAVLEEQWRRRAAALRIPLALVSHEGLSRGASVPRADLTIVDEAHRFRNTETHRYRALARRTGRDHLLLLTATPVVNRTSDLTALLRLFLPDNGLAVLGVPSLEAAVARRDHGAIARAATAVMVARSAAVVATGALPAALDAGVVTPLPVPPPHLEPLLRGIAGLQFPTFGDRTAARLLGMHLRYRFASSVAAGRETLRHHLAYLDRAVDAARRGERLTRPAAAALLREEMDGQLELELLEMNHCAVGAGQLQEERARVSALLSGVAATPSTNPKLDHLLGLLSARRGRKTIVFTAAIATAKAIADSLGWRETAVVSGKGGWIASGRIGVQEALSLFAPRARSAPLPGPACRVATLIATDLASEGLDLQDADAVVHFDLPWTPLRLDQRLGRIARLGSMHKTVEVHWFAPPPDLDGDLELRNRIAHKLATQFALGVPQSGAVGRARVSSVALEWRERLASLPPKVSKPRFAVVRGPPAAVFVVSWHRGKCRIPEILALAQGSMDPIGEPASAGALLEELLACPVSDAPFDTGPWLRVLQSVVRDRLSSSEQPVSDTATRQLVRHIVRRATRAARMRDGELLEGMDRALARLLAGVRAGQSDLLREAIDLPGRGQALGAWLASQATPPGAVTVTLEGAVFGDGSGRALSSRPS